MCSSWSDSTWKLAKNRRTYASRKWVMSKKKKRSQALSDSSDEEKNYGNTTPHGPAARGKTHKDGNSKGTCTLGSISPPVNQPRASVKQTYNVNYALRLPPDDQIELQRRTADFRNFFCPSEIDTREVQNCQKAHPLLTSCMMFAPPTYRKFATCVD